MRILKETIKYKFPLWQILLLAFIVICDSFITFFILTKHSGIEVNPIAKRLISYGWTWFFILKFGTLLVFTSLTAVAHYKKVNSEKYATACLTLYLILFFGGTFIVYRF
ncbi:DUF5658 family protein [Candidatus Parcubacteria bacterium]|nr:hypothetical protein [Patescibacteria group bacterium]MCG2694240.1 DUF5658 family protein [Candidatus Parcubacteria bacterium]